MITRDRVNNDHQEIDRPIKIMLVGPVPPPYGGLATYVQDLYHSKIENVEFYLFNTSFPIWVASVNREGKRSYLSFFEGGFISGIKKVVFVIYSYFSFLYNLIRYKPDVVQIFPSSYWAYWRNLCYLLEAKLLGIKTIFHVLNAIDVFYQEVGGFQKKLIRKSLNTPDYILVQSPKLQKYVEQFTSKKVKGFYNGLDLDGIPANIKQMDASGDPKVMTGASIGNLGKNKGTFIILDALQGLKLENITVNWIFIGRGDIQYFKNLSREYGIHDQIAFTGSVDENIKWQYLASANFYCLPSYAEGQPISIIEAMAIGLPIISTKVGSIPEMIEHGVNGYLIDVGDSEQLKYSIKKLIQNKQLFKMMEKNNRKLCLERHDLKKVYSEVKQVYIELLS